MLDGTCFWTTDKEGKDFWFDKEAMKGEAEDWKMRYGKRVSQCHAIGEEIKNKGFMDKLGLGSDNLILDTEKLFIGGQSMGGWTSIASCAGSQNIFSVSLSHDAAFHPNA